MRKRAFTLMELTVVVIIIGVLATLGLPAYGKFMQDSRARACAANLRALNIALNIYAMERDNFPAVIDTQFMLQNLAKNNIRLITCPNDPDPPASGAGERSYSLNDDLVDMTSQDYQDLDPDTFLIGDGQSTTFNSINTLRRRHSFPRCLTAGGPNYALVIDKAGRVFEVGAGGQTCEVR